MARPRLFVTLYEVSREYGGPEEGGWYFDWWVPIKTRVARSLPRAQRLQRRMQDATETPKYPRWSVLGDADPKVIIEDVPRSMVTDWPRFE